MTSKGKAIKNLQTIPGVGPSLARDLADLGYEDPGQLAGQDPQGMYDRLMVLRGQHVDRCVLYVFRCAVNWSEHPGLSGPDTLWWNWSDANMK